MHDVAVRAMVFQLGMDGLPLRQCLVTVGTDDRRKLAERVRGLRVAVGDGVPLHGDGVQVEHLVQIEPVHADPHPPDLLADHALHRVDGHRLRGGRPSRGRGHKGQILVQVGEGETVHARPRLSQPTLEVLDHNLHPVRFLGLPHRLAHVLHLCGLLRPLLVPLRQLAQQALHLPDPLVFSFPPSSRGCRSRGTRLPRRRYCRCPRVFRRAHSRGALRDGLISFPRKTRLRFRTASCI